MEREAQLIAIAEACGKETRAWCFLWKGRNDKKWKESPHYVTKSQAEYARERESHWSKVRPIKPIRSHENVPSYLTDLNAMYQAERVLLNSQRRRYAEMLIQVHPLNYDPRVKSAADEVVDDRAMKIFLLINMTAAQRAEAFLKTLGLWK